MRRSRFIAFLCGLLVAPQLFADNSSAKTTKPSPAGLELFEKKIRPLFAKHCFECHSDTTGADNGELILESPAGIEGGGSRGPMIVPGNPDASLLVSVLKFDDVNLQMPPEGKLSDAEIDSVVEWIRLGAPVPAYDKELPKKVKRLDIEQGKQFWSFQPLKSPAPPEISHGDWGHTPLDGFIWQRLHEEGLQPSPEADRRTLIRRLSFDLTGLPPKPEDVESFVSDSAPGAYERLVNRLLASPHYGERWARFWLDLARYTDTTASWLKGTGQAWLYRDWVVNAFNSNLPYDEFLRLQLAGDLLPDTHYTDLAALGFLGLSPTYWKELRLAPDVIETIVAEEWDERIDAVSRTFLGLTVACARCHDHKFDPISQSDYYGLAGVFASCQLGDRPLLPDEAAEKVIAAHQQVDRLEARTKSLAGEIKKLDAKIKSLQKEQRDNSAAGEIAEADTPKTPLDEANAKKTELNQELADVKSQISRIKQDTPDYDAPWIPIVREASIYVKPAGEFATRLEYRDNEPRDLPVFRRGNPSNPGEIIPRRFPEVLSQSEPTPFSQGSGRADLAQALLTETQALVARVFVNRIWAQHFGAGLVRTPSNFGSLGERPTHPELLDYLAGEFIRQGWDVKWLHRQILFSSTYRQSAHDDPQARDIDPENRLLWRMNRRRLTIEMWRDAMLSCAGHLDTQLGGPSIPLDNNTNIRRTIYSTVARRDLNITLRMFDFPEATSHSPKREPTTTPLQQLYVLNAPFVEKQANALVGRLNPQSNNEERIRQCYLILFAREPQPAEVATGMAFLTPRSDAVATPERWREYAHALLGLNEFLYLD